MTIPAIVPLETPDDDALAAAADAVELALCEDVDEARVVDADWVTTLTVFEEECEVTVVPAAFVVLVTAAAVVVVTMSSVAVFPTAVPTLMTAEVVAAAAAGVVCALVEATTEATVVWAAAAVVTAATFDVAAAAADVVTTAAALVLTAAATLVAVFACGLVSGVSMYDNLQLQRRRQQPTPTTPIRRPGWRTGRRGLCSRLAWRAPCAGQHALGCA